MTSSSIVTLIDCCVALVALALSVCGMFGIREVAMSEISVMQNGTSVGRLNFTLTGFCNDLDGTATGIKWVDEYARRHGFEQGCYTWAEVECTVGIWPLTITDPVCRANQLLNTPLEALIGIATGLIFIKLLLACTRCCSTSSCVATSNVIIPAIAALLLFISTGIYGLACYHNSNNVTVTISGTVVEVTSGAAYWCQILAGLATLINAVLSFVYMQCAKADQPAVSKDMGGAPQVVVVAPPFAPHAEMQVAQPAPQVVMQVVAP